MMNNLIIYRDFEKNPDKKIKYYKKLGVNTLILDLLDSINEESLDKLFALNNILARKKILLLVEIDIRKITNLLLDTDKSADFSNPKIRKSLYQFINYLIKHGIRGIYFRNLEDLGSGNVDLTYIRELIKNTTRGKGVLSLASLRETSIDLAQVLSNPASNLFDFVNYDFTGDDFISIKANIKKSQSLDQNLETNQSLSIKNALAQFVNIDNYPYKSHSLLAGTTYFLKGVPMISDYEEIGIYNFDAGKNEYNLLSKSSRTLDFYKEIFKSRASSLALENGNFRMIFDQDRDVLAYIRTYEDEKVLVFANFSQAEMLMDIRFHFLDLYDFKYLLGNYGRRTITKNLLLRPFEFVSFIKRNK